MINYTRRAFNKYLFTSAVSMIIPFNVSSSDLNKGMIYITVKDNKAYVNIYSLLTSSFHSIALNFKPHGIEPLSNGHYLLIEKDGPNLAILNVKTRKVLQKKFPGNFYGHGQYVQDMKMILLPYLYKGKNSLAYLSPNIFEISKKLKLSHREKVHMITADNNNAYLCIDSEKNGRVERINLLTNEVSKISLGLNSFSPGHIFLNANESFSIVGANDNQNEIYAPIINLSKSKTTEVLSMKEKKIAFLFWKTQSDSKTKRYAVVDPGAEKIYVIDGSSRIVLEDRVKGVISINLFNQRFYALSNQGIYIYDPISLKVINQISVPDMNFLDNDFHPIYLS